MKRHMTNFFVAFTLCVLGMVTIAGLNQAAQKQELTGLPSKVFDIEQHEDGIRVLFFDSAWVADRVRLEQLQRMGEGIGKSAWLLRSPGLEAVRCLTSLGLQQLPEGIFQSNELPEQQIQQETQPDGTINPPEPPGFE